MAFVPAPELMWAPLLVTDDPEATLKALVRAGLFQHIIYVFQLFSWLPVKQDIDNKTAIFALPTPTCSLFLCV